MLISAVLSILGSPEVPRRERVAVSEEKFPEVKSPESAPEAPAVTLNEARSQMLASADILRPLLPDLSVPVSVDPNSEYGNYLRALRKLTNPGKSHAVDVFE